MSDLISFVCLGFVVVLAAADVIFLVRKESASAGFTTNAVDLVKATGVALIGLWALARLPVKAMGGTTEPVHLVLHVGLALLSIGMALHRWREQR